MVVLKHVHTSVVCTLFPPKVVSNSPSLNLGWPLWHVPSRTRRKRLHTTLRIGYTKPTQPLPTCLLGPMGWEHWGNIRSLLQGILRGPAAASTTWSPAKNSQANHHPQTGHAVSTRDHRDWTRCPRSPNCWPPCGWGSLQMSPASCYKPPSWAEWRRDKLSPSSPTHVQVCDH